MILIIAMRTVLVLSDKYKEITVRILQNIHGNKEKQFKSSKTFILRHSVFLESSRQGVLVCNFVCGLESLIVLNSLDAQLVIQKLIPSTLGRHFNIMRRIYLGRSNEILVQVAESNI